MYLDTFHHCMKPHITIISSCCSLKSCKQKFFFPCADSCFLCQLAAHYEVHQRPVWSLPAGGNQHQQEEEDPRLQGSLLHILHTCHRPLVRPQIKQTCAHVTKCPTSHSSFHQLFLPQLHRLIGPSGNLPWPVVCPQLFNHILLQLFFIVSVFGDHMWKSFSPQRRWILLEELGFKMKLEIQGNKYQESLILSRS